MNRYYNNAYEKWVARQEAILREKTRRNDPKPLKGRTPREIERYEGNADQRYEEKYKLYKRVDYQLAV